MCKWECLSLWASLLRQISGTTLVLNRDQHLPYRRNLLWDKNSILFCSWNRRLTTFLGTTHEPRATWLDMATITPNKCTTGVRLLFRTKWIPRSLPAEEGMPPGLAGKQVILIFLLVPLLEALMLMIILPIKGTTTNKPSLQLITMLLSWAYWLGFMLVTVATTSSFPVSLQFKDRNFYLKLWWKNTDFCSNILFQLICLLLSRLLLSPIRLRSLRRNQLQVPFAAMLDNKSRFMDCEI